MSISSSLAAGVSGLNANAERLSAISDNIANSSTYGYKRSVTDFHSMVVGNGGLKFTAGGVTTSTQRMIDERGQLQTSNNSTDIAINGRGFLPVTDVASMYEPGGTQLKLMTTGSFRPNAEGVLVTQTDKVLLGWPASIDGSFPSFPRDSVDGLEPINVYHNQFAANPTTEINLALNLPSDESNPATLGPGNDITIEYFGNLGQTNLLNFNFSPTGTQNEWSMVITDDATNTVVGEYSMSFLDASVGGGTLDTVTTVTGGAYDPVAGVISLPIGGGNMDIFIGRPNESGGITQLDSTFAPSNISKNGSAIGNFAGVEIAPDGIVHAIYDSGFTRAIYQVPVIDVPNQHGLKSSDSQTYEVSLQSGSIFLWDAGSGPVGETVGFTREASTTDVAHELTQLIQTQRAYTSNAKVIQTVDEMLQETTNLKR